MTNPTTAEKVPVYEPTSEYMTAIGFVGTAKHGYVDLDDYKALTAELASLQRERDVLIADATALIDQLRHCHDHPEYHGVWVVAQNIRGPYCGPKYELQMETLAATLSRFYTARNAGNGRVE